MEVVLGCALLLNWRMVQTTKLLLGLIAFFTALTFYSAAFDKVTDCGCFGDAIKLTPWQSFYKDITLLIMSPRLASSLINAPHLALVLRIGSLLLFFNTLNQICQAGLAGFERFQTIAKVNIATGLVSFPLIIGGVYFWQLPGGVSGMALASALGSLLTSPPQ